MRFTGGATDTPFAPPLDYFRYVFVPLLQHVGLLAGISTPRKFSFARREGSQKFFRLTTEGLAKVKHSE